MDKMQKQDNESECAVMTLSEAIAHANEKSRELKGSCATNHSLLARWLTAYRDILSKSNKPAQDSSWHERGELPPVGCECWSIVEHKPAFIVANHCAIDAVIYSSAPGAGQLMYGYRGDFKPLRTEREKAIEEMAAILVGCEKYAITQNVATAAGEFLYDAGCRMVKP